MKGMTMKNAWLLIGCALVACGCATAPASKLAAAAGFAENAREVRLGPYSVHYGANGTNDLLMVLKGSDNICTKAGNTLTVYANGRSLFNYAMGGVDNSIAAFMIHIRDKQGNIAFTLMDENADGVFDKKIDYGTKEVYEWVDNKWIGRKP